MSFTRLGAKEELHLLVWLLMSCALKTIIQQLQNQASNKAKKLLYMSPMTKGQYSSDYHKIPNWILGKYMCFLFFFFFFEFKRIEIELAK